MIQAGSSEQGPDLVDGRRADRLIVGAIVVATLFYALAAWGLEVGTFSDPVGPRVYPLLLSLGMIASCLAVAIRPSRLAMSLPDRGTVLHGSLLLGSLIAYGYLLEVVGYLISTFAMVGILATLFGAKPRRTVIAAASLTTALYLIISQALGLYLPLGPAF